MIKVFRIPMLISLFFITNFSKAQNTSSIFRLSGSATALDENCFRLTPAALKQSGSVWISTPIDLRNDFTIEADINLGSLDSNGADGMAFVLQPDALITGTMGGGLGYGGIDPSLAVEFDTWQNDDPPFDHIALVKNGVIFHYSDSQYTLLGPYELLPQQGNAEDGQFRPVKFTWDATNMIFRCYYNNVLKLEYQGDIVNQIFQGQHLVYWGFTAATEGYFNEQTVCIKTAPVPCEEIKIFVPTMFTPNGDGINDRFIPLANKSTMIRKFKVFNRWGQLVFEKSNFDASDNSAAWDGRYQGVTQENGVYPYLVIPECGKEIRGTITLVR